MRTILNECQNYEVTLKTFPSLKDVITGDISVNQIKDISIYKHVPLMEDNIVESVKNNVFGTWNLLELSDQFGIETFVQISTDKAVNPTGVSGCVFWQRGREISEDIHGDLDCEW